MLFSGRRFFWGNEGLLSNSGLFPGWTMVCPVLALFLQCPLSSAIPARLAVSLGVAPRTFCTLSETLGPWTFSWGPGRDG